MSSTFSTNVRNWFSVSEASESDLPPADARLPDGWDEDDIILESELDTKQASPKKAAAKESASPTKKPARDPSGSLCSCRCPA